MIKRVQMEGLKLPRLYIAENSQDVDTCMKNGVPFVKWTKGQDELIRQLLRPVLEKMFPDIMWSKVLGRKRKFKSEVVMYNGHEETEDEFGGLLEDGEYDSERMLEAQLGHDRHDDVVVERDLDEDDEYSELVPIAVGRREFSNGNFDEGYDSFTTTMNIEDYVGDLSGCVNIEVLQKLNLLPKFIGDIADCIRQNLSMSMAWTEGYNKKLGVPIGRFNGGRQLPNLIILDVSASIPRGIAATMLTLIDTMRDVCDADLIITASRSGFYPSGCELPSPQTLREYYAPGQEAKEFLEILDKHISGREFGHVICFGDHDCPSHFYYNTRFKYRMAGTKVHQLHSYHTYSKDDLAGYCEWVPQVSPGLPIIKDNTWCEIMR